jgi:hypothetical protein
MNDVEEAGFASLSPQWARGKLMLRENVPHSIANDLP